MRTNHQPTAGPDSLGAQTYLVDGHVNAPCDLILAHGAGEGPTSPFLIHMALALAAGGVRVTRFAFPFAATADGGRPSRPPDRAPTLLAAWDQAITAARAAESKRLFIGGKSLGGRMASLIADRVEAAGLVCLGYPFHPPGHPERLRTEHLAGLHTPTLICQGTRDPFGTPQEVAGYDLSPAIRLVWIPDGDHSFKPRKASGRSWEANLELAAAEVLGFCLRDSWRQYAND